MPQGDHPDEIFVDSAVSFEQPRQPDGPPNKRYFPPAHPATQNNKRVSRSATEHDPSTGTLMAPQTPSKVAIGNLRPPVNSNGSLENRVHHDRPAQVPVPGRQDDSLDPRLQLPIPQPAQFATSVSQAEPPSTKSLDVTDHEVPVGFFTAKAAESLQNGRGLLAMAPVFNPHLESPSIRKTAGVDHTKTKPIGREDISHPLAVPAANWSNFVNPQTDKTRRLGMPAGGQSPLQNKGSYKPPQMKRPADATVMRSALSDMTAASINVGSDESEGVKRQKLSLEAQRAPNS